MPSVTEYVGLNQAYQNTLCNTAISESSSTLSDREFYS